MIIAIMEHECKKMNFLGDISESGEGKEECIWI
jgi:hypothetical protein